MTRVPTPGSLANLVPDEPRWIDLKGLLLCGRCDLLCEEDPSLGFVAISSDFPFGSIFGTPRPELVAEATAVALEKARRSPYGDEWQLLAMPDNRPLVEEALPGWSRTGIVLHRWKHAPPPFPVNSDFQIRLLAQGHRRSGLSLDHVAQPSRHELSLDWVSRRPMAIAVTEGLPVSFCYAAFTSERLWDVSVETLEPYRRRGLAAACFQALAAHMSVSGRQPTWGAMLDNPASLSLATKLGFVHDSTIDGWSNV